jgi:hypothetical protein
MTLDTLSELIDRTLRDASLFNPLILIPVFAIVGLAQWIIGFMRAAAKEERLLKHKHESLDRFSVPHDQDTDDDKPKRYMTIGDDGELVEMDE